MGPSGVQQSINTCSNPPQVPGGAAGGNQLNSGNYVSLQHLINHTLHLAQGVVYLSANLGYYSQKGGVERTYRMIESNFDIFTNCGMEPKEPNPWLHTFHKALAMIELNLANYYHCLDWVSKPSVQFTITNLQVLNTVAHSLSQSSGDIGYLQGVYERARSLLPLQYYSYYSWLYSHHFGSNIGPKLGSQGSFPRPNS